MGVVSRTMSKTVLSVGTMAATAVSAPATMELVTLVDQTATTARTPMLRAHQHQVRIVGEAHSLIWSSP